MAVSSADSGRAGEWPQSPSEEATSESAAQPCAAHRQRLTINRQQLAMRFLRRENGWIGE
ncbi:MAG: hypothetical protein DME37_04650 [Verrucomicrobia bacterium]|nr:MAG: hypothetical protein DME37_04650 [Verrucomicrobiota bacterium]